MNIRSIAYRIAAISPAAKELQAAMEQLNILYKALGEAEEELAPLSKEFLGAKYEQINDLLPGLRAVQNKIKKIQHDIDKARKNRDGWVEVVNLELKNRSNGNRGPVVEATKIIDELDEIMKPGRNKN